MTFSRCTTVERDCCLFVLTSKKHWRSFCYIHHVPTKLPRSESYYTHFDYERITYINASSFDFGPDYVDKILRTNIYQNIEPYKLYKGLK